MIQLYASNERNFQGHNGRVLAGVFNDTVTWELNTRYELQFDYPLFAKHGLSIENEMLITVPVPGYDDQAFRVNSVEKSMGVLTVHAYHVFWDLMQNFIEDTNVVGKTGDGAIGQILRSTQFANEFTYQSSVANVANARIVRMSTIAALIGTDENTFLSRWGGEFEWDNFHFNHVAQLGQNRGVIFRNGKNLLGYTATVDLTDVVTRIMPEGYNGLFLPEKYVDSPLINDYTTPRIAKIEYGDVKAIDEESVSDDDDALPLDQALEALRAAAKREYTDNHVDEPGYTFELNVVMLEDTEEFKDSGIFSKVYPGDTARFIHDQDGLDTTARLTSYTWSPSEKKYLTLGFKSNQRATPDIEHRIDQITNQIRVIDQVALTKAANNSNTIGWSMHEPIKSTLNRDGDLWYQQSGNHVIMWIYRDGKWGVLISDATAEEVKQSVEDAQAGIEGAQATADQAVQSAATNAEAIQNKVGVKEYESTITQLRNDINLRVQEGDVISQINLESGQTLIQTGKLYLDAPTVIFSGKAFIPGASIVDLSADKITAGTINAANVNLINMNADNIVSGTISGPNLSLNLRTGEVLFSHGKLSGPNIGMNLDTGAVEFKKGYISGTNGRIRLDLDNDYFQSVNNSNDGFNMQNGELTFYQSFFSSDKNEIGKLTYDVLSEGKGGLRVSGRTGVGFIVSENLHTWIAIGDSLMNNGNDQLGFSGDAFFWDDLKVSGSKNAIHVTRDGLRATPAYETAESYLGDIGEATTDETGRVSVPIETLFGDTVNTSIPYQVFLQSYSSSHVWVSSRDEAFFVVESDQPNAPFSWEIKAKRRGYESERLVKQPLDMKTYAENADGMESDTND